MRKILLILTFIIVSNFLRAQSQPSISPSLENEYCPYVITEFTVSFWGLTSGLSLTSNGNATINLPPYAVTRNTSTGIVTFKFKGSFNDVNIAQSFRLAYTDSVNKTKDFIFKKVKSLFYANTNTCGVINPSFGNTLIAPICQTANLTISFQRIKWFTAFQTPAFCFGEISDYEYKLPAGWKIGSATSTGNNWIQGTSSTVLTPTLSTGHNQYIEIRPKNTCGSNMSNQQISKFILIERPKPNISLAPTPASINCNSTTPVTYTVAGTATVSGITGYNWNLGSGNNGWTYNGSPAPQFITTTTNTLNLIPVASGTAPASVSVDVIFSGNCPVNLTSNLQFVIPGGTFTTSGPAIPCKTSISTYTLQQTPPVGTTVTWAISPNDGSVTISPNGNAVDVDASNANPAYYYNLTATISGYCYYATAFRQFNVPSTSWQGSITGFYGWSNPVYSGPLVEGDNYLYTAPGGGGAQYFEIWNEGINAHPGTSSWQYVSGTQASYTSYSYYVGFDLYWLGGVDSYYNYNYTDDCGTHSVPYHFISVNGYPPQYRGQQPPTEKYKLTISPNPTTSVANLNVVETDSKAISKLFDYNTIKTIYVYDRMGNIVMQSRLLIPKGGLRLNVSMLRSGEMYNVIIEDKNGLRLSGKLIKQ